MMKYALIAALAMATPALAEGDAAAGEDAFKRCKSCHAIVDGDNVIVRGGNSGPNLFGVVGRLAGSVEGARYSSSMAAAGEAGLVWDEEQLAVYVLDPTAFLKTYLGDDGAKSNMSKQRVNGEDIAAYLASVSPQAE